MTRWARGQSEIEELVATRQLQKITGGAANGEPLLDKADRTLATARTIASDDPDSCCRSLGCSDARRDVCVPQGGRSRRWGDVSDGIQAAASAVAPRGHGSLTKRGRDRRVGQLKKVDRRDQRLTSQGRISKRRPRT